MVTIENDGLLMCKDLFEKKYETFVDISFFYARGWINLKKDK